jgi:predicted nucleotidyltransferase
VMQKLTRDEIQQRIGAHEQELRDMGVSTLELFGSSARNETTESSDIDLLITFDRAVGLFAFYGVQEYLETLLECDKVDLVMRRSVIEEMKEQIYSEAVPCL